MSLREEIIQQALELSAEDRAFVADAMEQSLPHGDFASSEVAAAWSEEIDRRIVALERGEVQALDFEAAMKQLRQSLAVRRTGRANS